MSLAEIKSELKKLTPAEIQELETMLHELKADAEHHVSPISEFVGCARGTVIFHEGWDQPEPPETWHALRDDVAL